MPNSPVVASAILPTRSGLHARPSVKLTQLAKSFALERRDRAGIRRPWVDAKSPVKVMRVKAPRGATLHVRAVGADARAAASAIVSLVERRFDEEDGGAEPRRDHRSRRVGRLRRAWFGPIDSPGRCAAVRARFTGDPVAETEALLDAIRRSALAPGRTHARQRRRRRRTFSASSWRCSRTRNSTRPAFEAIATGVAADLAFARSMDAEIAGYESGDDDYFRARAGDLQGSEGPGLAALSGGARRDALRREQSCSRLDMPPSTFLSVDWSQGGGIMLCGRQPVQPCRHAGPLPGRADGGGSRSQGTGAHPDWRCWTAAAARSSSTPMPSASERFAERSEAEARFALAARELLDKPAVTRDGTRILVHINVADPAELKTVDPAPLRRHRPRPDGVPVPRPGAASRRGGAVRRLSDHRRMGGRQAGDDPHARCRAATSRSRA